MFLNLIFLYEKFEFKNNNSKNETKFDFDFEVGDECENNSYLDDGFICCNYSVCDKYCYKNICIPSNKIWFCYQSGFFFAFLVKHFLSIIFLIIGIIIRLFYHSKKEILIFIIYYFGIFLGDIVFTGYVIILFCSSYGIFEILCLILTPIYIGWFALLAFTCTDVDDFYIEKLITKESYSLPTSRNISVYLFHFGMLIVHLFNFQIIIDLFMYIIPIKYRESWQAINTIKVEDGGYEEDDDDDNDII